MYQYIKAIPRPVSKVHRPMMLSYTFMTLGGGLLLWVSWPIISFMVFTAPLFTKTVSPIPDIVTNISSPLPNKVLASVGEATAPDYTNANVWFPTKPQTKVAPKVNSYTLSIPKLKIQYASVLIGGDDLSKSLIHYGGTGIPGELGNAVVFGHSTLVQLFNPKDYKTIFSTLPTLKVGDDVLVHYDGITYRYIVNDITITQPNDFTPLEQRFDDSYITLITCVPPGTYFQRLIVKARLQKI